MFFLGKRKKDKQRENVSESIQENTQTVVEPEKSNHKADLKKEILEPEVTKHPLLKTACIRFCN